MRRTGRLSSWVVGRRWFVESAEIVVAGRDRVEAELIQIGMAILGVACPPTRSFVDVSPLQLEQPGTDGSPILEIEAEIGEAILG